MALLLRREFGRPVVRVRRGSREASGASRRLGRRALTAVLRYRQAFAQANLSGHYACVRVGSSGKTRGRSLRVVCALTIAAGSLAACSGAGSSTPTSGSTTTAPAATPRIPAADAEAITRFFDHLNDAYRTDLRKGYYADANSDYYALAGDFSPQKCVDFWLAQDGGPRRQERLPIVRTITATPKWLVPPLGSRPPGRVYAVTTKVRVWPSGDTSDQAGKTGPSITLHLSVLPNGTVEQFIDCALPKDA